MYLKLDEASRLDRPFGPVVTIQRPVTVLSMWTPGAQVSLRMAYICTVAGNIGYLPIVLQKCIRPMAEGTAVAQTHRIHVRDLVCVALQLRATSKGSIVTLRSPLTLRSQKRLRV